MTGPTATPPKRVDATTGEPVMLAHAVTTILFAATTAGWVLLPDTTINLIGSVVAIGLGFGATLLARARVTPNGVITWPGVRKAIRDMVGEEMQKLADAAPAIAPAAAPAAPPVPAGWDGYYAPPPGYNGPGYDAPPPGYGPEAGGAPPGYNGPGYDVAPPPGYDYGAGAGGFGDGDYRQESRGYGLYTGQERPESRPGPRPESHTESRGASRAAPDRRRSPTGTTRMDPVTDDDPPGSLADQYRAAARRSDAADRRQTAGPQRRHRRRDGDTPP